MLAKFHKTATSYKQPDRKGMVKTAKRKPPQNRLSQLSRIYRRRSRTYT